MTVISFTETWGKYTEEKVAIFNSNVIKSEHVIRMIESGECGSPYFVVMSKLQYDIIFEPLFSKLPDMEEINCTPCSATIK
jgi:hypothetical protein